ncbi:hypothetical protein BZZ01_13935 [Nostocales cyanobacterium HT-58-2]|nr:hypothetical protein BZZ01_13935 [Nostocales cyanobacterium HT-58-2]
MKFDLESQATSKYIDELNLQFESFPLFCEGESKVVRELGNNLVLIRMKPTLFSYKANRYAIVEGTEQYRLEISRILWQCLAKAGVTVSIKGVGKHSYVSEKVTPVPVEVVVKACHVGTPKHIYKKMESYQTRFGQYICPGDTHEPYVRFDWRNPLPERDECLPIWIANQYIDIKVAEQTALKSFHVLRQFLSPRKIHLQDICFFITQDGKEIYGEVSPDCMRVKYEGDDLDKDVFRQGKSADEVLNKYRKFLELIQLPTIN